MVLSTYLIGLILIPSASLPSSVVNEVITESESAILLSSIACDTRDSSMFKCPASSEVIPTDSREFL